MTPEQLAELRAELARLLASWAYAYAMGHGCSLGPHPTTRAVVARVNAIQAILKEHQA